MINSVHYFLENDNRIAILVYILKRTRLTPKMITANCHVIYKKRKPQVLCVKTHPSRSSLFMTELKMSLSIENRNYRV